MTDSATLFFAFVIALLVVPDLSEIGVLGVSMKRRLEATEQQIQRDSSRIGQLESLAMHQSISFDASVSADPTAAALAVINIQASDLARMAEDVPQKAERIDEQLRNAKLQSAETSKEQEGASQDASLGMRLLQKWESLNADINSMAPPSAANFLTVFREELKDLRSVRNAVAHAVSLDSAELRSALDLADQLTTVANRW